MRRQPDRIKRSILHVLIIILAVILVLLWIYMLGSGLADENAGKKISRDLEPFTTLKDNMVGGYNSIYNEQPEQ